MAICSGGLRPPKLLISKSGGRRPPLQPRFFHSFPGFAGGYLHAAVRSLAFRFLRVYFAGRADPWGQKAIAHLLVHVGAPD